MFDVVIPVFNKELSIKRALASIELQSEFVDSVVVVNDGSNDNSLNNIEEYKKVSKLNIVLINQLNKGVSCARNSGVQYCRTEFICFLDADDEWRPGYLKEMSRLISLYQEANLVCLAHFIQDAARRYRPSHAFGESEEGYVHDFFLSSAKGSVANSSKVAVRRSMFLAIGGFPEGIKVGEDLFFWIKCALNGPVAASGKTLVIVHRDFDVNRVKRVKGGVPYPVIYFSENRELINNNLSLKKYLCKIAFRHVAGSAKDKDIKTCISIIKPLFGISIIWGCLSTIICLIPSGILRLAKKIS
ncbi:glycosyltransferase family A protein [Marinobacter sp.]|jgi:glycosyltransferase involved in cell wall biosynthesis|uniref:glycosyltransferase family 2 protein n=1 Tax=Marinobacter sp. TaxID=50741 RepID=UPI0009E64A44|nr:glycosyltransferase family A protein [Marinobacter sp.]|tara:strand:+ start:17842 stop:18744 length:903 start_codon:yes stop_codon:yes gene_type:complete